MAQGRRGFISSSVCAAAFFAAPRLAAERVRRHGIGRELMRFGALSDIHVTDDASCRPFERALKAFDEWKADGVLVCGDLADWGVVPQLKRVGDVWLRTFPKGRRSDGQPIANLIHYGDHDTSTWTYRNAPQCVAEFPDEEGMKRVIIPHYGREKAWEECFQEPWHPIEHKNVKGFDFILSHFARFEEGNPAGDCVPALPAFLASAGLDPARPFFYSQHRIPKNTVGGAFVWGQDDGTTTTSVFAERYPNCFAFCGHCHLTCTEERAIWQDSFTCVQVPSLSYTVTLAGRENGMSLNDRPYVDPIPTMPSLQMTGSSKQGFFVSVHERAVVIRRHEFAGGASLGPDWVVPLPVSSSAPYSFARRAKTDVAPQFAPGAEIAVSCVKAKDRLGKMRDLFRVEFPTASSSSDTPRANDYEVAVEIARDDVVRIFRAKRVFSQRYTWDEKTDAKLPVYCCFGLDEVPSGMLTRFTARPCGSFGARGRAISTPFARRTFKLEA